MTWLDFIDHRFEQIAMTVVVVVFILRARRLW